MARLDAGPNLVRFVTVGNTIVTLLLAIITIGHLVKVDRHAQSLPQPPNLLHDPPSAPTIVPVDKVVHLQSHVEGGPAANCADLQLQVSFDGALAGPTWLVHNMTVTDRVETEQYRFYQACIARHDHVHIARVALKVMSGDADLYVSTDIQAPTAEHSTWISAGIGSDVIDIPSNHPDWDPESSTMFIGVKGVQPSSYSLTVTVSIARKKDALGLAKPRHARPT